MCCLRTVHANNALQPTFAGANAAELKRWAAAGVVHRDGIHACGMPLSSRTTLSHQASSSDTNDDEFTIRTVRSCSAESLRKVRYGISVGSFSSVTAPVVNAFLNLTVST